MAKCRNCGSEGFFLKIDINGLCNGCSSYVVMDIGNRARIYNESISIIVNSENPQTVLSRISTARESLEALLVYERKGITTITPLPSIMLNEIYKKKDIMLSNAFQRAKNSLDRKLATLKTTNAKINQIQKFLDLIDEYLPNMGDKKELLELKDACVDLLNNYKATGKVDISKDSQGTTAIKVIDVHPAKLVYFEEKSSGQQKTTYGASIKINIGTGDSIEIIGPAEPSVIFKDLPVRKPRANMEVPTPPYYPSYTGLTPEQRWIYLNWLENIRGEINIGYVFLYYYGLERHLVLGDFETAFEEIILLRSIFSNKSFESYSYNALLYSSAYRQRYDLVEFLVMSESRNGIDDVDLMFFHMLDKPISCDCFLTLARKVKGLNLRYFKAMPERFKAAMSIILTDKYGFDSYPIASLFEISSIPRYQSIAFANISFPSSMRLPSLPNFLKYPPFVEEYCELFTDAHALVKEDLIREKLLKD